MEIIIRYKYCEINTQIANHQLGDSNSINIDGEQISKKSYVTVDFMWNSVAWTLPTTCKSSSLLIFYPFCARYKMITDCIYSCSFLNKEKTIDVQSNDHADRTRLRTKDEKTQLVHDSTVNNYR